MVSKRTKIITVALVAVVLIVIITLAVVLSKNDDDDEEKPKTTQTPVSSTISEMVETDCGKVKGKLFNVTTDNGEEKSVYTFKGIPYAVPPEKELRWKPPVALSKDKSKCWSGTLNYNDTDIICKQANVYHGYPVDWKSSREDCLVLNVRTPAVYKTERLPVLFYIHGGGLVVGYGEQINYHPDEQLTATLRAVTVTINYRIGIFGFLSLKELWETTGDDKSYANYSVMDAILALKWVRNNIANFGGNPDDITIFGHSSGGTIAYSMILSDLSRGLFTKAIVASGAPLLGVSYRESNRQYRSIIETFKCNTSNSDLIEKCLQNLDPDSLLTISNFTSVIDLIEFPFNVPVVGLPLIVTDPVVSPQGPGLMPLDVGGSLDVLITSTAQDILVSKPINSFDDLKKILSPRVESFKKGLYPDILAMYLDSSDKVLPENVTAKYVYDSMTSDITVTCSNLDVGRNMSMIPNYNIYSAVYAQGPDIRDGQPIKYAEHTMDMNLLFVSPIIASYLTGNEKKLRSNIRDVYRRFINSDASFKTEYEKKPFVFWNNTMIKLNHPYHEKECDVWRENGFLKYAWTN